MPYIYIYMAYINLIAGSIRGRLGQFYGQKGRSQQVIKAVPFSKRPPTSLQRSSLRAFEALNRLAGSICRLFWPYLGLKRGPVLRHNIVTSWLRSCISNHTFDPNKLSTAIPADNTLFIRSFIINPSLSSGHLEILLTPPYPSSSGGAFYYTVIDSAARKVIEGVSFDNDISIDFYIEPVPLSTYYCIAFRSDRVNGKYKAHGLAVNRIDIPLF